MALAVSDVKKQDHILSRYCYGARSTIADIELDEYVIMSNHFHAIIINTGIGAHLCVRPDVHPDNNNILGEHAGSPLHAVVQWFKTMTTNEYIRTKLIFLRSSFVLLTKKRRRNNGG